MLIDSHVHLNEQRFDEDRDAAIDRAREAGVEILLEVCGTDIAENSLDAGMKIIEKYPFVYGAVGVHPHEAALYNDAIEQRLVSLCGHNKIIGWGEIGLDYYYDHSPRDIQQKVLRRQLNKALELKLPVIIHTRDAEEDTEKILREEWLDKGGAKIGGIFHCFTGSMALANFGVSAGFNISFSGVITFKKSQEIRDVAANVPLHKLLIETDCPFLAPEPHRGKRNEPAFVSETANKLAEIKNTTPQEIARITSENFLRLFKLSAAH